MIRINGPPRPAALDVPALVSRRHGTHTVLTGLLDGLGAMAKEAMTPGREPHPSLYSMVIAVMRN
jgi:hypothetical protein